MQQEQPNLSRELLISKWMLSSLRGEEAYHLDAFGSELAKREGFGDIDPMEAIYLYLIRTYHWLPREVRAMTTDDLKLALHVEMQGWTVPEVALSAAKEARAAGRR